MKKSEHINSIVKIIQNGCDLIHTGVWMELFGGQKKLVQCFTPIDLCKADSQ